LLSIVDYNQFDPAVDERVFPNTPSDCFWSSLYGDDQGIAWYVDFSSGRVAADFADKFCRVRCAR
jgi:hypothetical protein